MRKQKGFTAIELIVVLVFISVVSLVVGVSYHFIHKFW